MPLAKKLSTFAFLGLVLVLLGASCQPTDPTDQRGSDDSRDVREVEMEEETMDPELIEPDDSAEEPATDTTKADSEETPPLASTCTAEGQQSDGNCCEGLESVAKDHAFSTCEKIGTPGWEPGGCSAEGEMPYISSLCCEGLTPVSGDDNKQVCVVPE